LEELHSYAEKFRLPLEKEVIDEMFYDIVSQRAVTNEKKREAPLNLDEI